MSFKKSFIKLFKYDNKSYIEIVSGKFSDPEIILINGIKIGISKTDFLKMFFKDFSANQIDGVKVIKLISGLEGISHVYVFTNGHLIYFYFNTDYTFDKN